MRNVFAEAVGATNYAVEGVAQKISEKALRGLAENEKIGPRGLWWGLTVGLMLVGVVLIWRVRRRLAGEVRRVVIDRDVVGA